MKVNIFYWRSLVVDVALLINRALVSASLLVIHGLAKLKHFNAAGNEFPDPFHFGPDVTFYVACFATVFCPLLIMAGLLTRIATACALGVTLTGLLLVHAHDPLVVKDTPYIYSVALAMIFLLGPGKYSLDQWISTYKSR
jgi:putative oxidoreductase